MSSLNIMYNTLLPGQIQHTIPPIREGRTIIARKGATAMRRCDNSRGKSTKRVAANKLRVRLCIIRFR